MHVHHAQADPHKKSDNRQTNKQTTEKLSLYVSLILQVTQKATWNHIPSLSNTVTIQQNTTIMIHNHTIKKQSRYNLMLGIKYNTLYKICDSTTLVNLSTLWDNLSTFLLTTICCKGEKQDMLMKHEYPPLHMAVITFEKYVEGGRLPVWSICSDFPLLHIKKLSFVGTHDQLCL